MKKHSKYNIKSVSEYQKSAQKHIIKQEDVVRHVYVDFGGIPSTANGKALVVYGRDPITREKKWVIDPAAEEFLKDVTGKGYTSKQRKKLIEAASTLNRTRPNLNSSRESMDAARKENVPLFYTPDVSADNTKKAFNQRTYQPSKSTFGIYLNQTQVDKYSEKVFQDTERRFTATLRKYNISIPPSTEREGLVSIYHQTPSIFHKPEVVEALKTGNRAQLIEVLESPQNMPKTGSLKQRRQDDIDIIKDAMHGDKDSFNDRGSYFDGLREDVAAVGRVAFETAMSLGKDTLAQAVVTAVQAGGAEDARQVLAMAAKAATGQMLVHMHGLVMQEVTRQQGLGFNGGWASGISRGGHPSPPDGDIGQAIEDTMNDPRNAGVFNTVATRVRGILETMDDADPAAVLAAKVLESLRDGQMRVQPHIFVPNLLPQEDGAVSHPQQAGLGEIFQQGGKPSNSHRFIEVAGLQIPVRLPEIVPEDVIIDESGAVGQAQHPVGVRRGADGKIYVQAYTRRDGTRVASHARSTPDDDVTNNISFRRKG
ncbi:MAG: hypothetical protein OXR68_05045 [Alphaproteobacteria bacterium]|nr:hypothetical protein [Alphaproteobacteria bacterium]MDD9919969.1 hypothetical protein [Alphaproteobacteria bacterium]